MDCHRTLLPACALLTCCLGCTHQTTNSIATSTPAVATKDKEKKVADLPKRQPLPATCVAFGAFRESLAADPRRTPVEQQQLRDEARRAYQQALNSDPQNL